MTYKLKDDPGKQEYQYSYPQVFPDGSQFSVYSSPDNGRVVLQHTSGSHLEFKADGSVYLKAVRDIHIDASVQNGADGKPDKGSAASTISVEGDLIFDVEGKFKLNCKSFDLETKDNAQFYSASDMNFTADNIVNKATQQISMESSKSMYVSTKEMVEAVIRRVSEVGTKEGPGGAAPVGGINITKVHGNAIIQNDDLMGGITIKSAGYLNLVCGAERVDVTGDPMAAIPGPYFPSMQGRATYTHIVRPFPGPNPRGIPGSVYWEVGPGGWYQNVIGPTVKNHTGPYLENITGVYNQTVIGTRTRKVVGPELVAITGIQKVTAVSIFLN